MVPELPVEIHRKIYAMACMDDGLTGCALSFVSRCVRETSAEFRWFSIAVAGGRQVQDLHRTLSSVPADKRNIAHLYVSDTERPFGYRRPAFQLSERASSSDNGGSGSNLPNVTVTEGIQSHEPSRQVSTIFNFEIPNFKPRAPTPEQISRSIMELLMLLAPSLETLSLALFRPKVFPSLPRRPNRWERGIVYINCSPPRDKPLLDLSSLSFPQLKELTLRGNHTLPHSSSFAPHLRLLHLADESLTAGLEGCLAVNHPQLTHLRISRLLKIRDHYQTISQLLFVLRIDSTSKVKPAQQGQRGANAVLLPEGVPRFYLIEPGPTPGFSGSQTGGSDRDVDEVWRKPQGYHQMTSIFSKCSDLLPNFAFLPKHPGYNRGQEAEKARRQWADRIERGPGCWVAPGKEISGL